nr:uncharacterized protein LOC127344329 [Lolium perenne]
MSDRGPEEGFAYLDARSGISFGSYSVVRLADSDPIVIEVHHSPIFLLNNGKAARLGQPASCPRFLLGDPAPAPAGPEHCCGAGRRISRVEWTGGRARPSMAAADGDEWWPFW